METTNFVAEGLTADAAVEDWLRGLASGIAPSKAIHAVLQRIIENPKFASFASTADMALASGVNGATVTRAAQAFGLSGWPEWRQEIRARYLGRLSAPELAVEHDDHVSASPFDATISKHLEHIVALRRGLDRSLIVDFARIFAAARRRLIVASGSYAAIGRTLAHHAGVAGYRCEVLDDSIVLTHALADLTDKDVVIPITFWRLYNSAIAAAREAKRRNAPVLLISDQLESPIAALADLILHVPSEGASFFPSIVPSVAVVEAICAQLAKLDPERTSRSIKASELQWQEFNLLYFNSRNFEEG